MNEIENHHYSIESENEVVELLDNDLNFSVTQNSVDFQIIRPEYMMGLENEGNTCYALCIIQVLRSLRHETINSECNTESHLVIAFQELMSLMNNTRFTYVSPNIFLENLQIVLGQDYNIHQQQPEILLYILNHFFEFGFIDRTKCLIEVRHNKV